MIENVEEGYQAYKTYLAVKQHFTSDSYDYEKYHGKINAKLETFLKRKDKFFFRKVESTYKGEELVNFYVANFIKNNNNWHGNITNGEAKETYQEWKERQASLVTYLGKDLEYCHSFCVKRNMMPNELLRAVSGEHPYLLRFYLQDNVQLESIIMMDDILNFLTHWDTNLSEDVVYEVPRRTIKKYKPFLSYDKTEVRRLIVERLLS